MRDGDIIDIIVDEEPIRYALNPEDELWYRFEAVAGTEYIIETFDSEPIGGSSGSSLDPELYLYDDEDNELDYDDDNGTTGPWDARIVWTAPASGTYYIKVIHYYDETGVPGTFGISVVVN